MCLNSTRSNPLGHWKHHQLPNVCPKDLWQLNEGARFFECEPQ
jgi:hypothetical protein